MSAATDAVATPGEIRVAVVDDHPVLREGIASLLAAEPDIEVVTKGESLADARSILQAGNVDVLVLDVRRTVGCTRSALTRPIGQRWSY